MNLLTVDTTKCKKDGICVESCPARCLVQGDDGLPVATSEEACFACGHCVAVCPHGALANAKCGEGFTPAPEAFPPIESVEGLMKSRRSVREFKNKPVPRETLARLVDIARFAPTAVNAQLVRWTVVEDPAKTRALAALCADFLRGGPYPRLVEAFDAGDDTMLRGAPHVLVAHTPASWDWGVEDSVIALTYAELAAPSLGLGVCWAGILTRAAQHAPRVAEFLGLPGDEKVHGALMLGLPKFPYKMIPPRNPARVAWL